MRQVYGELLLLCEKQGLIPPSYKTFTKEVKHRSPYEQQLARQGPRAAYSKRAFYWELQQTTPRHGSRPFDICHIDHTQLDIELVSSQTGQNLGRPWATFLVDAFSRRLLALYITFDPPSYRSCMMVLRVCVKRHARLPQTLVVDGGREFKSTYFETLLARYECTKKTRPGAKARFGSICERLFGTANTTFIHNLTANTQIMRNVRQVTKAVNPKNHAVWTLDSLYQALCQWAYDVYDTIEHPALGQPPREAFALGLEQGGLRQNRFITYDKEFLIFTFPSTTKGTAKVNYNSGVKINYIQYWADIFRNPEIENTQIPVRYDPNDMSTAYAFVQGQWIECISECYAQLKGRTEREIAIITAEMKKRNQRHAQRFSITARQIAEFIISLEAEEILLEQRLRDRATQAIPEYRTYPPPQLPNLPQVEPVDSKPFREDINEPGSDNLSTYEDY